MVSGPSQSKPDIMVWARSSLNSTMSYNQDHGFGSSASSRTFMIAQFALRFGDRNRTSGSIGVRFCLSVDDTYQFETVGYAYLPNPQGG